ncbi:MAG TPA: PLP-dependent aminotransferase family protein [Polyangiaceae bacterium]
MAGAPPKRLLTRHERLQRIAAALPDVISFAGGLPDPELFPERELCAAFRHAMLSHGRTALQYGWPEGSLCLRRYVAALLGARGADVDPKTVIITSGAQQAIALTLTALRRGPRFVFATERECYPGALDAARARGATFASLEARADVYYVMPEVSNPRGQRLSERERSELLERARAHDSCIIEDDAYAETAFSGELSRPLLADAPERVFQIGTFSKTLCPGLRIGWLVPPPRFARRILRAKQTQDLEANGLSQSILEAYLATGHYAHHLQRSRHHYARRARLLFDAVQAQLPSFVCGFPRGGFSLWLEAPFSGDDQELLELAIAEGTSFDPGSLFRREPRSNLALRLSYSALSDDEIASALPRLARAVNDHIRRRPCSTNRSRAPNRPSSDPAGFVRSQKW